MSRTVALLAALVGMAWVSAAAAQSYVPPDEIVIYLHKDLRERDFIEGLVCELGPCWRRRFMPKIPICRCGGVI